MPKIVSHNENRETLMNSAINAIAKYGFEGLTTKLVAEECRMNEAYIYRYFLDKNDLLKKSFLYLDNELFTSLTNLLSIFDNSNNTFEENNKFYFLNVWDFFKEDIDKSKFYIRFFYSSLYDEELSFLHEQTCRGYFMKIKDIHPACTGHPLKLRAVLSVVLSFANQMGNVIPTDDEDTKEQIYDIIKRILSE